MFNGAGVSSSHISTWCLGGWCSVHVDDRRMPHINQADTDARTRQQKHHTYCKPTPHDRQSHTAAHGKSAKHTRWPEHAACIYTRPQNPTALAVHNTSRTETLVQCMRTTISSAIARSVADAWAYAALPYSSMIYKRHGRRVGKEIERPAGIARVGRGDNDGCAGDK